MTDVSKERREAVLAAAMFIERMRPHDFGPSTRCPDCGNTTHSTHVWRMGWDDAIKYVVMELRKAAQSAQ